MTLNAIDGSSEQLTAYGVADLAAIANMLRDNVTRLPPSYIPGRTVLRDSVMDRLGCSAVKAERIVDQLESSGFVRFEAQGMGLREVQPRWHVMARAAR